MNASVCLVDCGVRWLHVSVLSSSQEVHQSLWSVSVIVLGGAVFWCSGVLV